MIKITDNIYLDADEHNFIVVMWNGKYDKNGNMQGAIRRYYSEPSSLINGIVKILLRQAVASSADLHEISMKLNDIKEITERVATNAFLIIKDQDSKPSTYQNSGGE